MDRGLTASGWCGLKPDLGSGSSLQKVACNMFDENPSSDSEEWRSPNHILEITIRKAFYPITESVLRQIFDRFGVVQQVHLIGGLAQVLARVVFSSKHEAADAFGELHGRNIYDGCSQMDINWGLSQELGISIATRDVDRTTSLASVQFSSASDAMSTQYRTFQEHVVTMDKSIAYSEKFIFSINPSFRDVHQYQGAHLYNQPCCFCCDNHGYYSWHHEHQVAYHLFTTDHRHQLQPWRCHVSASRGCIRGP